MQEKMILTTSLIVAVLGLAFLFLYADKIDTSAVARMSTALPEEEVVLTGMVTSVVQKEKVLFLKLEGEKIEVMDIVLFPEQDVLLPVGSYVEITGTVEEYQGKKEVVANKVVVK